MENDFINTTVMVAVLVNLYLDAKRIWIERNPRPLKGFGGFHWFIYGIIFIVGCVLSGTYLSIYLNVSPDQLSCRCGTYDGQTILCEDKIVVPEHVFNCTTPYVTLYRDCQQYARENSGLKEGITVYLSPTRLSECPDEQHDILSLVIGFFCMGCLLIIELIIYYTVIAMMMLGWAIADVYYAVSPKNVISPIGDNTLNQLKMTKRVDPETTV